MKNIVDFKNILIMRGEGSLGDAVLSSCCYREIKKANPNARISVACFGGAVEYLRANKYIDEMFIIPANRVLRPHQRWPSLVLLGLKLRRKKFDLVIDSSHKKFFNWRLFKWLCCKGKQLDYRSIPQAFFAKPFHAREHEEALMKVLIKSPVDSSYDIPVPPANEVRLKNFLEHRKIKDYILLNVYGSIAERSFNKANFLAITSHILKDKTKNIITPCMPRQSAEIKTWISDDKTGRLAAFETQNVFDLFALIKHASLVITPDTSAVHIAAGFERPTIAFFNTHSAYNDPFNKRARVIKTEAGNINYFNWADFERAYDNR